MATLIQIRRGTSSQWSSANPVLASGELAISTDLEKIKIGDGSSTWSNLLYINLTPAEIQSAIDSSVSSVLDGAPALLDTLNELAAALGDDENFAATITNSLADKLDISTASSTYLTQANAASSYDAIGSASAAQTSAEAYADGLATNYDPAGSASAVSGDLSDHELSTTSVHGITNTADLATKSYVDTAESDAVTSANSYSDSLATNYDAAGSAATAQSNANTYTDTEISTHNSDTTNVHGIADTSLLATTSYVDTAADSAESAANSYSDGLAVNYDPAGSAATAESNSNSYTDTAVSNLVDSSPEALNTLNELAAALGDDANFATTVASQIGAKADTTTLNSHTLATTSVHGITNTANLIYTNDSRLSDTRTPTDNSVTSAKIANGAIVNEDINESAEISPSKISGTAVIDNDSRLTDSRTPTAHATSHESGGSDELELSPAQVTGTAVVDSDSRLTDARTPTSHAATHEFGGTDEIEVAQSQVTGLTTDLSAKSPLASPTFTGVPAAPTAAAATNTTQLATTAFVTTANNLKANLASPTFTGIPIAPTASSGTDTTQIATTEYVQNELSSFSTLPDQTGNAGEFLTTDGTNASWAVLNVEPTIHPMFIIGGV